MAYPTKTRAYRPAKRPLGDAPKFRVIAYYKKKFGKGTAAWLAFMDWMPDVIGRTCQVSELTYDEAERLVGAMKRLNDAAVEGQPELF